MLHEVMRKRPAEVVRPPAATLVDIPRPVGTHVVRRRTKSEVLKELGRLQKRGYVYSASALARVGAQHGGGFAGKIALKRALTAPMAGWAKGCALVGSVMTAFSVVALFVINALASLFAAAALLPWALIGGAMFAGIVGLLVVRRLLGGGGITISQKVNIR
jgi:hypothetical protein